MQELTRLRDAQEQLAAWQQEAKFAEEFSVQLQASLNEVLHSSLRLHAQRPDGEEVGASLDALLQGARAQLELQVQARIQQAVRGRGGAAAASG